MKEKNSIDTPTNDRQYNNGQEAKRKALREKIRTQRDRQTDKQTKHHAGKSKHQPHT